ncbi:MAG TPA: dihydrofolate reductase family protein [Solirubrobacteraceae bacterium]|nr:dihydrofolate reductase family protein [Solirubrobacteraceae bacterium]
METASYRRLLPDRGETDATAFVESLELRNSDTARERPYTIANFVASVDGRATIDGLSRKLSDPGDRELFRSLRERADGVLVGTGTLAAENYGRMLPQAERRERRVASGRPPEPLVVSVTNSGRLPLEIPLFSEPDARVILFSSAPSDTGYVAATVIQEPLTSLAGAFDTLGRDHGVRILLCEGGPTLFGALVRERLVDELFLTLAPRLVGGASGPSVLSDPAHPPPEAPVHVELAGVLERNGTLFLRYRFAEAP